MNKPIKNNSRLIYILGFIFFSGLSMFVSAKENSSMVNSKAVLKGEDVFIKMVVAKNEVFVGEAFTLSYQLFSKVNVIKPENIEQLSFTDCEVRLIERSTKIWKESINGDNYQVLQLASYNLVPLKHGKIVFPRLNLAVKLTLPPVEDDFFEQERIITKTVQSQVGEVNVVPLPPLAMPKKFAKAVGKFEVSTLYQPNGETLKVTIISNGTGSLRAFTIDLPTIPPGLTKFDQSVQAADTVINSTLRGTYRFSCQINSGYKGSFIIPNQELYFFNPHEKKYVKFVIPSYEWEVKRGKPLPAGLKKRDAIQNRSNLNYSKIAKPNKFRDRFFINSSIFWSVLILSIGLLIVGKFVSVYRYKRYQNPVAFRYRQAFKNSETRLKQLPNTEGIIDDYFLRELNMIFCNYVADRLGISILEFSVEKLKHNQKFLNLNQQLKEQMVDAIQIFDHYRFDTINPITPLERSVLINRVGKIIGKIQQGT